MFRRVEGACLRGAGGVRNRPALGLVDEGTVGPGQVLHFKERSTESSHWRVNREDPCPADTQWTAYSN